MDLSLGFDASKLAETIKQGKQDLASLEKAFVDLEKKTGEAWSKISEHFQKGMEVGKKVAEAIKKHFEGLPEVLKKVFESIHKGFEKAFEGLRVVMEKVGEQIERGAALKKLSNQTGESVSTLFQLQKAFKAAGGDAKDVAPALTAFREGLKTIASNGKSMPAIFARAGLSMETIKKAGSVGGLTSVLESMSKMSHQGAMKFGTSVFGDQAGKMVELSRGMNEFRTSLKESKTEAAGFQRMAAIFQSIELGLDRLKEKLDPIFFTIAEHIAPVLQKVVAWVNSIDLSPLSDGIGKAFDIFAQAFQEGKVMELLAAGFAAAVEYLGNLIFGVLGNSSFWSGIWDMMVGEFWIKMGVIAKAFLNLGVILKAALIAAFNAMFELIGKIPKVGEFFGLKNYKADSFGETFAQEKEKAAPGNKMVDQWISSGAAQWKKGAGNVTGAVGEAMFTAGNGPAQEYFKELTGGLLKRVPKQKSSGEEKNKTEDALDVKHYQSESTSIEKMGFVFGGGMVTDHAATTASNTTKMVAQLASLISVTTGGKGGQAALTNGHAQ